MYPNRKRLVQRHDRRCNRAQSARLAGARAGVMDWEVYERGSRTVGQLAMLWACLFPAPACAADLIEALGGERCGAGVMDYTAHFLAPESAQVEVRAKALLAGQEISVPVLTIDRTPCK